MAGEVVIKDGSSTIITLSSVQDVQHIVEIAIEELNADGSEDPAVNHNLTVFHVIQVDFELIDTSGGTTKWQKRDTLVGLKAQAANLDYYTLIENDDTENSGGYSGVVKKVIVKRNTKTKSKITGTLLFLKTADVYNY